MSTAHRPFSSIHVPSPPSSISIQIPTSSSITPTSTSTLTSTPISTPTSTPTSTSPPSSQTNIIVGVVIVVVTLVVSSFGIAAYIRRLRSESRLQSQNGYRRHSEAELDDRPATSRSAKRPGEVDKSHVAARITPFGSSTNLVPRFNHSPGNDMRIATRRPDGSWEFSNPGSPFNPAGVDELEPPASSSSASMYLPSPAPTRSTFKVPTSPRTKSSSSTTAPFQSSLPPTPETPSFPPGLSLPTPPIPPSLPPSTPTTPQNVTTFSASSSSTATTPTQSTSHSIIITTTTTTTVDMPEPPKSPAQIMKERESRAARLIRQGYDDREFNNEAPPPAYGYDPSSRESSEH